ncbi:MAG: GNAT family N-acetyltransferase [Bacteroidota bacterium]
MLLRPILPTDNAAMANVIRTVMPEFQCVGEGFSINDPEVDDMAGAYAGPRSAFFVVEGAVAGAKEGSRAMLLGGGGYAPLAGGDGSICELRKMYLLREGRGRGAGRLLMDACLAGARAAGYRHMYLETVTAMTDAAAVYHKYGFEYLNQPLGDTGHSGCDRYMLLAL